MISPEAAARRDAHRQHGKFGVQPSVESGAVCVDQVLLDPDEVVERIVPKDVDPEDWDWDEEFPGYQSDTFQRQAELVRNAIWGLQGHAGPRVFTVEFPHDSSDDCDQALVGFTIYGGGEGLRILRSIDIDELTDDTRATGKASARAIASAMVRNMDQASAQFEMVR